jgi:hypothetical protein
MKVMAKKIHALALPGFCLLVLGFLLPASNANVFQATATAGAAQEDGPLLGIAQRVWVSGNTKDKFGAAFDMPGIVATPLGLTKNNEDWEPIRMSEWENRMLVVKQEEGHFHIVIVRENNREYIFYRTSVRGELEAGLHMEVGPNSRPIIKPFDPSEEKVKADFNKEKACWLNVNECGSVLK